MGFNLNQEKSVTCLTILFSWSIQFHGYFSSCPCWSTLSRVLCFQFV